MKKSGLFIILITFFALMACGHKDASPATTAQAKDKPSQKAATALYQNQSEGISIKATDGWTKDSKLSTTTPLNVVFTNGKVKAIVTVVPAKDSFNQIKANLKAATPHAKVIKEKADFLSYKTSNKESIETDAYLEKKNNKNYIVIFMMPASKASSAQSTIHKFMSHTSF